MYKNISYRNNPGSSHEADQRQNLILSSAVRFKIQLTAERFTSDKTHNQCGNRRTPADMYPAVQRGCDCEFAHHRRSKVQKEIKFYLIFLKTKKLKQRAVKISEWWLKTSRLNKNLYFIQKVTLYFLLKLPKSNRK